VAKGKEVKPVVAVLVVVVVLLLIVAAYLSFGKKGQGTTVQTLPAGQKEQMQKVRQQMKQQGQLDSQEGGPFSGGKMGMMGKGKGGF